MFDTVIVPVDESALAQRAVVPAAELADRYDAELILLHAHGVADEQIERTEKLVARSRRGDGETRFVNDERKLVPALAALLDDAETPLVCMASHGEPDGHRAHLSTSAEQVLRAVSQPVLLFGPALNFDTHAASGPVLACLDGSATAEQILPVATSWTMTNQVPLHLVSIHDPGDAEQRGYLERQRDTITSHHRQVALHIAPADDIADGIIEAADRLDHPIIAMTTHGRRGLSHLVAGSVTMRVLGRSPHPVLVTCPGQE